MNLLTSEQVLDRLGISRPTLYLWIKQGKVPALHVGRRLRFREEDVNKLITTRRVPPPEDVFRRLHAGWFRGAIEPWKREDLYRF